MPGLWCAEYRNPRYPKTRVELLDGVSIAMAHADQDLGPREHAAALILTGHTHVAKIEPRGKHVFINPGHLKSMQDRGQSPSYAIIETLGDAVVVTIKELNGTPRSSRRFAREGLAAPGE